MKQVAKQGWFKMDAESLLKAIERRNLAARTWDTNQASTEAKQELRHAWKVVRKAEQEAIEMWVSKKSEAIPVTIMAKNPKFMWGQVRVLKAGLTGCHRKPRTERHVDESGTEATNDSEDADNAAGNRFRKVSQFWKALSKEKSSRNSKDPQERPNLSEQ